MSASSDFGSSPDHCTACFSVHAPADISVMSRVLDVFSRQGILPSVWHSTVFEGDPGEIQIDVQVAGLEGRLADRVAQLLRQLVCVRVVLTSEKRHMVRAGEAA